MKTVLLIEDNLLIRENTAEILTLWNYNVITVENGSLGIALAQQIKPDLIISDIDTPGIDGFEVLNTLKRTEGTSTIPFILLTSNPELKDRQTGYAPGVDAYLCKPFDDIILLKTIKAQLKAYK